MTDVTLFDDTNCQLGEGPLWHPERQEFFWFDINAMRLYAKPTAGGERRMWQFDEHVSAAGWVDRNTLLVATETALVKFDIESGTHEPVVAMEADNSVTRSNDGRADPYGGFWIGTMGKNAEADAGAIYRYYRGELRQLYAPWTIPNSMCFSPDGKYAYLADTPKGTVWRQALSDSDGWPEGAPEVFLQMDAAEYRPDGAVVDAEGNLWIAHYGHYKVTQHAPDGTENRTIPFPARSTTCPAFTGADLSTLLMTSATQKLDPPTTDDGRTYAVKVDAKGQEEHQVIL